MITEMVSGRMAGAIRYVEPVRYGSATGLTAELYRQMRADFMLGPVLTLHSPAPEVMTCVWSVLRETLLAGRVDRASKETVAAAVSKKNQCPFCVDAHTLMLRATSNYEVADAILQGEFDAVRDPHLRTLVRWASADQAAGAGGVPSTAVLGPGAAELVGTA